MNSACVDRYSMQHRTTDFDFVLDGILSILEIDLANTANFLPGSRKPVPYILEACSFVTFELPAALPDNLTYQLYSFGK